MSKNNNKKEKKERVIHTRVSDVLDDELKERAEQLGVSVSNLVRNVLANTFGLVENLVADTARAAGVTNGAEGRPDIIGYQDVTLSINAVCQDCNELLPKGTRAAIAVTASGTLSVGAIRCVNCAEKAEHPGGDQ